MRFINPNSTFLPLLVCICFFIVGDLSAQCIQGDCENGQGLFVYESGTRYEGNFKEGKPFGNGICYYANGDRYEGEWNIFPEGKGTFFYADGRQQYGVWDKNVLVTDLQCISGDCKNGKGVYEFPNGDKYEGEFVDGKFSGLGILKLADGSKYVGDFEHGQYEGYGSFYAQDGSEQTGIWEEGEYAGTEEELFGEDEDPVDPESNILTTKGIEEDIAAKGKGNSDSLTPDDEVELNPGQKQLLINPNNIKVWAVVVGVSSYKHMPRLNYTDDDAYQIFAFLKSPEGGALPDEQIRVLIDESATKENIEKTMEETFSRAGENDVVILYFSGHGLPGYFLPIDVKGKSNRLAHTDIKRILDNSPAKYKLCIADACHSGSLGKSRSLKDIEITIKNYYQAFEQVSGGTALMLSSKSEEISLEANGLRQGIFSHFLIRGLKGEADGNADKIITIEELFGFVSGSVSDYTVNYQTPVITGDYDLNMPVGVLRY
ncbi:MAG: caspase family protein [Bacteroidota bacterium]